MTTAAVAGTLGITGAAAATGPAAASPTIEHFTFVNTSAPSTHDSVIATGAFAAGGTDSPTARPNLEILHLTGGTIRMVDKEKTFAGGENPTTCVLALVETGTYRLTGGTGAYRHIAGSGTISASTRAVFPRSANGTCSPHALPEAFQLIVHAGGPVTRP